MLSKTELERALASAGLGAPVQFDEVTGSTNRTAWDLADAGAPQWTLVAAGHQTSGRGRLGRAWEDAPGSSLLFSLVLRPTFDPAFLGVLPLWAGASMALAIRDAGGPEVRCKWPNDLVVRNKKVGGILCESSVEDERVRFVVVGIGVNLGASPPVPMAEAVDADAGQLLAAFLKRAVTGFDRMSSGAEGTIGGAVAVWGAISATLGRTVRVERPDAQPLEGHAEGVDQRGALIVLTSDGSHVAVTSGDVIHLR
jgi:BirA family biotin operon repressor/biotin-[acetyl-CoA-carboxylase] ligase